MEQLMSCRTAATYYSMSEAYFRKLLKERKVPFTKIGYNTRMKKSELDKHFEEKISQTKQTSKL